ncbi:TPA: response regulator, partial [Citrobacter farmeri]
MTQPLVGKQILIVEDEPVFRSLLDSWFSSLGATTALAGDGLEALDRLADFTPDLMICDLAMPRMNGLSLVEHLRNRGDQTPILVISATENMADIAKALRLGVDDVLLKPVKDLTRLRETVFACLYPNMFNSRVEEEERLFRDWDAMVDNPAAAAKLLQELQPPV